MFVGVAEEGEEFEVGEGWEEGGGCGWCVVDVYGGCVDVVECTEGGWIYVECECVECIVDFGYAKGRCVDKGTQKSRLGEGEGEV